jgi:hypothetical protein
MPADKLMIDDMAVDKMTVDKMPVYKITIRNASRTIKRPVEQLKCQ